MLAKMSFWLGVGMNTQRADYDFERNEIATTCICYQQLFLEMHEFIFMCVFLTKVILCKMDVFCYDENKVVQSILSANKITKVY